MLISRSFSLKAVVGAALVLLLGLVGTAEARKFAMSGKWVQRRGGFYIPFLPFSYGIPAIPGAKASVQPGGTLTVPANQFGTTVATLVPMGPQPSVIQLSSHFTPIGPKSTGVFKAGHWMATRLFKDFAFCPGTPIKPAVGAAANPNCLTPKSEAQGAPPGSGKAHGLIRYKAGTNAYGGTMQMISQGGGVMSFLIGAGPTLMHNPFHTAPGAAPTEAPGGPYANTSLTDVLPAGPITSGAVLSPHGLITVPGTVVGYGTTATWFHWGFPWTTGKVYLSGTNGGPYTSTFATLTGSDARTPLGAGNITLVAGGIANGLHGSRRTYMSFDRITMKLALPANPLPSMSPAGVAAGALLMVLAVGYALRRRF
jgi:hypothetical protein